MPLSLPITAIPCRLLLYSAPAARRKLPTGVLHQLADAAHLTQVDLDRRDREVHVPHREGRLRRLVRSPRLFDGEITVDRRGRVGLTIAPQIEEALAFHSQLEPPLCANRSQSSARVGERGIESDFVRRPLDAGVSDQNGETR